MESRLRNNLVLLLILFTVSCEVNMNTKNECEKDFIYETDKKGVELIKYKDLYYRFREYHKNGKIRVYTDVCCCDSVLCVTYHVFNENGDTLIFSQKRGHKFYGLTKIYENNQLIAKDSIENGIYTYRQSYLNGVIDDTARYEFLFYPRKNESSFLQNDTFYVNFSESKKMNFRIGMSKYENNIKLEVSFLNNDSIFYKKTNNEDFKVEVDFNDFPKGIYKTLFRLYENSEDSTIKYFYSSSGEYTIINR